MFEIMDAQADVLTDTATTENAIFDPASYSVCIVGFSGGKDSVASLLACLEAGFTRDQIELHHQLVDGRESNLMDWECTTEYCRAIARAFGVKYYESFRVGGFEAEMLRNGTRTGAVSFEMPDGTLRTVGGDSGPTGVRRRFPQVSASLQVRWCSAALKIDVQARVMTNDPRFSNSRTLIVTGERAEESASRAKYLSFEPHRTDLRDGKARRHVDHWRPVHGWSEEQVWAIIAKYRVNPHPAYHLGFGRVSCRQCIFGNADQWATIRTHMPYAFEPIANYEREFKVTIHRTRNVNEQADRGTPYPCTFEMLQIATSKSYQEPIFLETWTLPAGAFKDSCGPT